MIENMKRDSHNFHIAVAGVMGVGKTTLSHILGQHLKGRVYEEQVAEEQLLSKFYSDMKRWALDIQTFYLENKIRQYLHAQKTLLCTSAIQDTPVEQNLEVYAYTQHTFGYLKRREYQQLEDVYASCAHRLPRVDLFVFLTASPRFLVERLRLRNRESEQSVSETYLKALCDALERLKEKKSINNKVISIPVEKMNPKDKPEDVTKIINMVTAVLYGK